VIGAVAALVVGFQVVAYAASLTGSKFEIDQPDANMVVDGAAGNLDWANVNDAKSQDLATGGTDNSYQGGVKEDDPCPAQTTGTIPNNKSDLRYFGVYQEQEVGGPGWLHLFWTRVSEPSGATLMDFEFNKSKTKCTTNGSPNVQRTVGDLLIEYKIEGGTDTSPDITLRKWTGTAWGTATTLPPAEAIGAINLSPISNPTGTADNSDGTLPDGTTSENRTFGEASIDLSAIFDPNKCESFGSAMLKSRAGPPFDSQLKDFIAPNTDINIQNCGKVIIRKETLPDGDTTSFNYTKNFTTDPATTNTFSLKDGENKTFNGVLFANDKTVVETIPANWALKSIDCSASTGVTPDSTNLATGTVQFDIDNAADVLDCTFTNEKQLGALAIQKNSTKGGAVANAGAVFSFGPGATQNVTDNGTRDEDADVGEVCVSGLTPGDYTVNETSPPNGYGSGATNPAKTVTVVTGSDCTAAKYPTGAAVATFTNPPLADLQVNFRDGGSDETSATSMSCTNTGTTANTTTTTGWDSSVTHTGIKIDPSPRTVTCTIVIDP